MTYEEGEGLLELGNLFLGKRIGLLQSPLLAKHQLPDFRLLPLSAAGFPEIGERGVGVAVGQTMVLAVTLSLAQNKAV